jgi:hypothetical protein
MPMTKLRSPRMGNISFRMAPVVIEENATPAFAHDGTIRRSVGGAFAAQSLGSPSP